MNTRHMMAGLAAALFLLQGGLVFSAGSKESTSGLADQKAAGYSLDFDATTYTEKTATVDGQTFSYRAYEGIVYVRYPVDVKYQTLNFYVRDEYYQGKAIGGWTAETSPIFFPNSVGGYMPAEADKPGEGREGGPNAALVALSKGLVVACPGARGRTTQDDKGVWTGKAPSCIVDLKAAVRYLRHNDSAMPGSAERIISNGTSAGGALSALLGSSGNSKDYETWLKALGAADERDDIFAASCYCPITNLDHADMAYEWLFSGVNTYKKMEMGAMIDFHMERKEVAGTLTQEQIAVASQLKALFPDYLNSLSLRGPDGKLLTLKGDGTGSFRDWVKSFVIASAQKAKDSGTDLSKLTWIEVKNGTVTDIDFDAYIRYAGRMKLPPAFDALDLSSGENSLFGTSTVDTKHFTDFSMENSTAPAAAMADSTLVNMMNPLNYIGTGGATTSRYYRIRHGTVDRDTSLAIPAILAATLENKGYDVDFALPWERPHSGDYDLEELFAWVQRICK